MAEAALNEEEQKAWDEMKGDSAKPETKVEAKVEEKAPEAKVEEKPKPEEKKDLPVVPKAALDQARIENKELRKEMEAMKSLVSDGDKRLKDILEKIEKVDSRPAEDDRLQPEAQERSTGRISANCGPRWKNRTRPKNSRRTQQVRSTIDARKPPSRQGVDTDSANLSDSEG
jgi:hypothetical protein